MFDFLRNLTQSAEVKRQERLSAYLDDALTSGQRSRFEEKLAADAALRQDLRQMQAVKRSLGELPRARVPRAFTLDPAKYGRPAPQPAMQLYPVVRVATALTAIMLIVSFLVPFIQDIGPGAGSAADEAVAMERAVEITRVVTETQAEEMEFAAEEAAPVAAEMVVEAEVVVEEAAEAEAVEEAEEPAAEEELQPAEAEQAFEASPWVAYPAPPQPTPAPLGTAGLAQAPLEADETTATRAAAAATATHPASLAVEESAGEAGQPLARPTVDLALGDDGQAFATGTPAGPKIPESRAGEPVTETSEVAPAAGPSTAQVLQIVLGLVLVALILATWLLRGRQWPPT